MEENDLRLLVIKPFTNDGHTNDRLDDVLESALDALPDGASYEVVTTLEALEVALAAIDEASSENGASPAGGTSFTNGASPAEEPLYLLWAVDIGRAGINLEMFRMLDWIRSTGLVMKGCIGGIIIDGESTEYTKSIGRMVVHACNDAGCSFPGRCLVEGPAELVNYRIQARNLETDLMGAYRIAASGLVKEMLAYNKIHEKKDFPKILMLHASDSATSNTLALWELVKSHLDGCGFREINLRDGEVMDCRGCSYEVCRYFSGEGRCFYGGTITEKVYPGVLETDCLVLLCPNYNDAISANLAAFVNRMTSLFVRNRFYDKSLFGIIVSGYSGGDIIAEQLISGLCMNKTFSLPANFAMIETANEPGEIMKLDGIEVRAKEFADRILEVIHK